jgi:hypothetical protein
MPSILYYPPNPNSDPFWDDVILFMPLNDTTKYTCLKGRTTTSEVPFPGFPTIDGFECTLAFGFVSHDSLFNFSNSDLTIECFVRTETLTEQRYIFSLYDTTFPYQNPWVRFFFWTSGQLLLDILDGTNGYQSINSGSFSFSLNTWYHVAVTRQGSSWKMWINGTQQGSVTDGRTFPSSSDLLINLLQGGNPSQSRPSFQLRGYVHDLRITKACRYTAAFSPPTVPLPTS